MVMANLSSSATLLACGRGASLRSHFTVAIVGPGMNGPLMIDMGWGRDVIVWPLITATVG